MRRPPLMRKSFFDKLSMEIKGGAVGQDEFGARYARAREAT